MGLAPGTWTPPLAPMEAKHGVSEAKAAGTVEGLMGTKAQLLFPDWSDTFEEAGRDGFTTFYPRKVALPLLPNLENTARSAGVQRAWTQWAPPPAAV